MSNVELAEPRICPKTQNYDGSHLWRPANSAELVNFGTKPTYSIHIRLGQCENCGTALLIIADVSRPMEGRMYEVAGIDDGAR